MYNRYYPYRYNRSEGLPPPPVHVVPKPPAPPSHPPKPHEPPKKKFDFKTFKKDTCTSLNDVECFLNDFCHTWKYIKLIKLLK